MTTALSSSVRKTAVAKPTPQNLLEVAEQLRQIVTELQGVATSPAGLRAVRVQELARIGVVQVQPDDSLAMAPALRGSGGSGTVVVGGILPLVTGRIINDQPEFVFDPDDGTLIYTEVFG